MKNNYLLESQDSLSLQKKIDELIEKNDFLDASISYYDLDESSLNLALEDLDTYSFLTSKKVIVIRKIELLNTETEKDVIDHLMKYIKNPNLDNLLIITASKLDERKKFTKDLKKVLEYIKVHFDSAQYIKNELKGYTCDSGVTTLLIDYCKDDITKLHQECNKLKLYKENSKKITKNDVLELVVQKLGDSSELTFSFSRSLLERDKKQALKQYKELLNYQVEPFAIIGLLASQIRIIYQVKILQQRNLSNDEIAKILKEKSSYRISKTKELTKYYTKKELLDLMISLEEIDLKMKSSDINPNFLIELFIFNL